MPAKRGAWNGGWQGSQRTRNGGGGSRGFYHRIPLAGFLVIFVVTPLVFLAARSRHSASTSGPAEHNFSGDGSVIMEQADDWRKQSAIESIDSLFPKEVIDVITANTDDSGSLNLNIVGRNDLSSSWVLEKPSEVNQRDITYYERQTTSGDSSEKLHSQQDGVISNEGGKENPEAGKMNDEEPKKSSNDEELLTNFQEDDTGTEQRDVKNNALADHMQFEESPTKVLRRQLRQKRREKRSTELIQQDEEERVEHENAAIKRSKEVDSAVLGKYSIWRRENENENSDSTVRLMRDQLIMARVYSSISQARNNLDLYQELMVRTKECQRALGEAITDSDLPPSAPEKIKAMGHVLSKARELYYDCTTVTKKLRAMLQSADEQVRTLKKQSTFLSQLAAKTVPKGLHCLSMRLTIDYYLLPLEKRNFPKEDKLEDPSLYHYALFSDNVLAASVVVNSTIVNAKESEKHVFHLVTDKLNFGAMKMWFLLNPPGKAAIHVENVDDFKWLNSSYCPVLRQLESAAMKEYYFKADHPTTLSAGSSNLKYRNPKYLSMLNHLRFYLPQVYPKLDKILFLDDDIVVQKDLTALWSVDLHGKVNGAVETCGESFHRFDKYLNFSNPHIARHFDPNACGWAYGMNVFDLKEWKKQDITGIYHKWQNMNEDRVLWKLGTLPPGLITFYGLTHPLDKSWHVLGLGYNPSVDRSEIDNAAVVHYNGNMKPWLELAMTKYRPYWTKYIKYDHPFLQQCNINE